MDLIGAVLVTKLDQKLWSSKWMRPGWSGRAWEAGSGPGRLDLGLRDWIWAWKAGSRPGKLDLGLGG